MSQSSFIAPIWRVGGFWKVTHDGSREAMHQRDWVTWDRFKPMAFWYESRPGVDTVLGRFEPRPSN